MTRHQGPIRWAVLGALLATLVALIVAPGSAQAATPLGSLTLDPPTGQAISPITVSTVSSGASKGCPDEATYVGGTVTGPGDWAAGIGAFNSSESEIQHSSEFSVPMANSFTVLAADNGLTVLPGKYTLTLYCQDAFGVTQFGEFTASVWFTDSTHYQTTDPATPTPTATTVAPTPTPTATETPQPTASTPAPTETATPTTAPSPTATTDPANPAPGAPPVLGSLTFDPPTGQAISPIIVTTVSSGASKGCPAEATNVGGIVTGPGGWAIGIDAFNNSDTEIQHSADFNVPMVDSFTSLGANKGLTVLPGKYTLTLYCQDQFGVTLFGQFTAPLWFTDAVHYQSTDPNTSQTGTETVVTASPEDRADLAQKVTLTATITPSSATGSVQFRNLLAGTYSNVGTAATVSGGKATLSSTTFGFALYQFSAVFTPADPNKLEPSTSGDLIYVVAKPLPPIPKTSATVTGTVRVGKTVGCSATFTGAKSRSYQWIRGRKTIVGTKSTYRLVSNDGAQSIRCRALATNTGGTTSRTSKTYKVAR